MCSECIATSDYWVRETRHVWECAFWRSKVECSKHTHPIDYSEMLTENYSWTFIYSLLIILWLTEWNILSMFLLSTVEIVYGSYDINILMESQPKAVLTQLVSTNHTLFIYTFVWFSSLSLGRRKFKQTTVLLWHNMHVFYSIVWKIKNCYAGIWKYASQCWHTYDAQTPEQTYKPPYT